MNAPTPQLLRLLTPREREVLAFRLHGMELREVAAKLSISTWTVETHLRHIAGKLGINGHECTPWIALASAMRYAEGFEAGKREAQ